MRSFLQDLRQTIRQWKRAPAFTAVAVVTIAVGIGGTTTMMSVTDAVLLRTRPGVRNPKSLVEIRVGDRASRSGRLMSFSAYEALRDGNIGLTDLAAGNQIEASVSLGPDALPELLAGVAATGNFFSVLGTRPALGRFFSPEEVGTSDAIPVAVLSHRLWTRSFGRDPSVLGRTVTVNRVPLTVIGVAEEGFHGHLPLYDFSLFVPFGMMEALSGSTPQQSRVATVGRLDPAASIERVRSAADRITQKLRAEDPAEWISTVFLVEPHTRSYQEFRGPISLFLGFLLALSGCILLIACANIGGLLLSRSIARSQEVAVRRALGAGRGRLARQFLTETLLLFFAGGALGFVFAFWATKALGRVQIPLGAPLTGEYAPDPRVLAVSLTVTLASGLVFGLVPALRASNPDLASVLRDSHGQSPGRHHLRRLFVLAQVAGSVVLLGGSGLLFKALNRAHEMDLGFDPQGVHVATVNLKIQQYGEEEGRAFFSSLLERGATLPGVLSAALSDFVFLSSPPERAASFTTADGDGGVLAGIFGVTPGFFATTGTEILEGRPFEVSDAADSEPVAIVNERVAGILWPEGGAVGQFMRSGESLLRVVGVAKNGKYISIGESGLAGVFRPHAQAYTPTASLLLKVREGSPDISRSVVELVRTLDADIPLTNNDSHFRLIGGQLMPRRMAAIFAGILGLLGLFLATVGLYGVLSFLVAQRAPGLAIRIALGADPGSVRRSVIRGGVGLVLGGLLIGVPASVGVSSLIRRFLYGLDPADPAIMGGVTLLFVLIAWAASYLPARQATATDPSQVLRKV
jgi:predicted permease